MKQDPYVGDTRVECAFSTQPDDPNPAWVDITEFAGVGDGVKITRGRQDEFTTVSQGQCTCTLDNTDGRFTQGYAGSPFYPNVKIRKMLRVTNRDVTVPGNLLSVEDATFEGGTLGDWFAPSLGVAPALANSSTHAHSGSKAMRITWGAGIGDAQLNFTGLVIGRQYVFSAYVFVPSGGSPNLQLLAVGAGNAGAVSSGTNAFVRIFVAFVAVSTTQSFQVQPSGSPSAGQQAWVDDVQLDEGPLPASFTTTAPPIHYLHTGYLDEVPTEWPGGGQYSEAKLVSIDRFKRLGLRELRSAIEEEVLLDSPFAYYTLSEPATASAVGDISGNGRNSLPQAGIGVGGEIDLAQGTGPGFDGLSAPVFAPVNSTNGKYFVGPLGAESSNPGNAATLGLFFNSTTNADQAMAALNWVEGGADWDMLYLAILPSGKMIGGVGGHDSTGAAIGFGNSAISPGVVTDGQTHHAAVKIVGDGVTNTFITLYLDGAIVATATWTGFGSVLPWAAMEIGGANLNRHLSVFAGTLSHVAAFDAGLSDARVAAHAAAGLTGFTGERSDQRVARVASYVGVPAAQQVLEVGLSTTGPAKISGQSALAAMQAVESTENGLLFVDGQGRLMFHARSHRYNTVSASTLAGDDVDPGIRFVPNDQYLINDVTASRDGGITYRAMNQASIDDYFVAHKDLALTADSDNEVIDAANYLVNTYATPVPRPPNLTVDILTKSSQAAAMLGLEFGTRITLATLPAQAPAASSDWFMEGVQITITDGKFEFVWNTSPATANSSVWQLGSATFGQLDSTTRLAY